MTTKPKKKTDPGSYTNAELAATLGTVGSRVGELEKRIEHLETVLPKRFNNFENADANATTREALRQELRAMVREELAAEKARNPIAR